MAGEEGAGGSGRRHMDLNLHVGLPPLPRRPRVRLDSSATSPTLMPNSTGAAPEALRTSEPEHTMLDPIVYSWPSELVLVDGLLVARSSVRPSRVVGSTGTEVVDTRTLGQSTQGAATTAIEAGAPELRLLRVIQVSQQHNIVRPRSANLTQSRFEATRGQNLDVGDNPGFVCSVCLELARQPVVTSCGHLFCWPCLYRWLYARSSSFECPVCKGVVLTGDITPIYRRCSEEEGGSTANLHFPPRPQAHRRESLREQLEMAVSEEQPSTSSAAAAIVGEPGPSTRSRRPSEPPTTIRRTRRRPQQQ